MKVKPSNWNKKYEKIPTERSTTATADLFADAFLELTMAQAPIAHSTASTHEAARHSDVYSPIFIALRIFDMPAPQNTPEVTLAVSNAGRVFLARLLINRFPMVYPLAIIVTKAFELEEGLFSANLIPSVTSAPTDDPVIEVLINVADARIDAIFAFIELALYIPYVD